MASVVPVQKSGFGWALNRDNGSLIWVTEAGPGSSGGGGTWGAATDGKRIYTNIVNNDREHFTLKPSNKTATSGGWAAMDARDGESYGRSVGDPSNGTDSGPVSLPNVVCFLLDQLVKKVLYLQPMLKLGKFWGRMRLELQFMVGC
ncbi:Polyvinylalcohol dehydrogenase [Melia azedarach]|uniref:Polyvinylalcohol dehydrogenase n=1 Tax=Melia azedarach TaxID=155640 RepID=A0ACC1X8K2_MELAZ|nr:Polyvinylalcohol dehydrogenase [Melia azedarach]